MTGEELFLLTLDDLEECLQLRRRQYDVLDAASLLRKLLEDGQRSLLRLVTASREPAITFTVRDWLVPDPLIGNVPLLPEPGQPTLELTLDAFLLHPALGVGGHEATDQRWLIQIRTLILFLANNFGGVHVHRPSGARDRAIWDYTWSATYITPQGQFGGAMQSLIEVGHVTLAALQDIRDELATKHWPTWLPEPRRGSRRPEDPRRYDLFSPETAEPQRAPRHRGSSSSSRADSAR